MESKVNSSRRGKHGAKERRKSEVDKHKLQGEKEQEQPEDTSKKTPPQACLEQRQKQRYR